MIYDDCKGHIETVGICQFSILFLAVNHCKKLFYYYLHVDKIHKNFQSIFKIIERLKNDTSEKGSAKQKLSKIEIEKHF